MCRILTEAVIAILLHLLWKVKMKLKQKLGLGLFLCLSIFMVITAIVRISALRHTTHALGAAIDAIDVTWKLFWQQVEACIAVLMVSFTAFRSIFMAESSKNRDKEAKPWYSTRQRILRLRRKAASDEQSENSLPAIPGATLTGMRTFIRGGQDTSTTRSETVYAESSDGRPLPKHPEEAASAVLCYGAIEAPLAQPRALIGGHFVSALTGVCITKLFSLLPSEDRVDSLRWLAGSLSTAVAIVAMQLTRTMHPPAGATALLAAISPDIYDLSWYYLPVILLSSFLVLVTALLFNNIQRRYPMFWIAPAVPAIAQPSPALGAPLETRFVREPHPQTVALDRHPSLV
ncbi:MAG: hypothetical protein M1816_001533 [Peltula sp. TS41687]|nr:MAG: hypothetical protein M1816_001533 [Peltula sp. TS41687]